MSISVPNCAACGKPHLCFDTSRDEQGEHFFCYADPERPRRVDVQHLALPTGGVMLVVSSGMASSTMEVNAPQRMPVPGVAPATWDLVIADMQERDRMGTAKYGVRHQYDNGRDHLVDSLQESYDLSCYLRAEVEKRKRMVELARVLVDPQNSAPLTELLSLILGPP